MARTKCITAHRPTRCQAKGTTKTRSAEVWTSQKTDTDTHDPVDRWVTFPTPLILLLRILLPRVDRGASTDAWIRGNRRVGSPARAASAGIPATSDRPRWSPDCLRRLRGTRRGSRRPTAHV